MGDIAVTWAKLVTEPIATRVGHTFGYAMRGSFKLIIRGDGYINSTKLCALGGKEYRMWSRSKTSKKYITNLEEKLRKRAGHPVLIHDCIILSGTNPIDAVVSGTYVHPELLPKITFWLSGEFDKFPFLPVVHNTIIHEKNDIFSKGTYCGLDVTTMYQVGTGTQYINGTILCRPRNVLDWMQLTSTKNRMLYYDKLIPYIEINNTTADGIYIHPKLMLELVTWIGNDTYDKLATTIIGDMCDLHARNYQLESQLAAMVHEQQIKLTDPLATDNVVADTNIIVTNENIINDDAINSDIPNKRHSASTFTTAAKFGKRVAHATAHSTTKKIKQLMHTKITDIIVCDKHIDLANNAIYAAFHYKTEAKLYNILSKYHTLRSQFSVDWCKNHITNRQLPFDFVIDEYHIIIELDGDQHFIQVQNWQSPTVTQQKDIFKMKQANINGYSVIRLLQVDVWRNKNNWLVELNNAIEKIRNENNRVQNIYITTSAVYDPYRLGIAE